MIPQQPGPIPTGEQPEDEPVQKSPTEHKRPREEGDQFLLKEVDTAREFMNYDVSASDRRIDLLMAITYAAAAGLLIAQAHVLPKTFLYIAAISCASLFVLGLAVLFEVVRGDIRAVRHVRAINKIRRYFVKHISDIEEALALSDDDHHPSFRTFSGRRHIPIVINALSGSMAIVFVHLLLLGQAAVDTAEITVDAAAFSALFLGQELVVWMRYWIADHVSG